MQENNRQKIPAVKTPERGSLPRAAGFLLLLLLAVAALSAGIQAAYLGNDELVQERNKSIYRILREPENTLDLVIIGDSLSYAAVSPMEIWISQGIPGYVCGQSGQTAMQAYHMLKTVYRTQSPKVVILETDVLFKNRTGTAGVQDILLELEDYYIPLFRGHDIWKTIVAKKRYPEQSFKGFTFRRTVAPYTGGEYMQESEEREPMVWIARFYLDRIVSLCRKHDAELLLLSVPSPMNYHYAIHNTLSDYAASQGLTYLDLNLKWKEIGISWEEDCLDGGDHLNFTGAVKLSDYLGKYLAEHADLPDHRGEEAYAAWEEEAEVYQKSCN